MNSKEVRQRFVDYFKKNGHTHVSSSRLVPDNDPTLLFTNSGMVQFKNTFLGIEKRPYKRAVTHQKSVRAGGKHNDLENVGHTARHHTFFEMLGNFSFGDYFKKDAIRFGWEFLTEDLKISKDRLYVTIFRDDDEAFKIWHEQEKVPTDRISRFDEKDNFWQMGETGPCGPCSEIFYDHGPKSGCGKSTCKVGCSCDRFVEIWNLVFMQFNKDEAGKLTPLPKPSIDTGAGLERMTAVMQGVASNYDTDLFTDLFKVMTSVSKKKYGSSQEIDVAMRVMADHSRATAFLIADGVLPSNEGQGYVLRRIMRRGIRYGRKLSEEKSLIAPTVKEVIKKMSHEYPELKERADFIISTVETEETRFIATLDQGTHLLNAELAEAKKKKLKTLSGEIVFKLYDTYGFPVDLTKLMAHEVGLEIDLDDFETRMKSQKTQARASWKGGQTDSIHSTLIKAASKFKPTKFTGYETLKEKAKILGLLENNTILITDKTPFYAEGGGQVGDYGTGLSKKGKFKILDTKKINDVYFHFIETHEKLNTGEAVILEVAPERKATMANHSATHLLHAALRKTLGEHVTQAGSLVEAARLRFDFTHTKPLTHQELIKIEELINHEISLQQTVDVKVSDYKKAIKDGAMALFGEKYSDKVRTIKMGEFSHELCGGTHVSNTSEIRLFKIMSESGVSSGVRRIEAITGDKAVSYLVNRHEDLSAIEETLKSEKGKALEKVKKLADLTKKLERDVKTAMTSNQSTNVDDIVKAAKDVKGTKLVSQRVPVGDRDVLSSLSDKIKDKLKSGIVILIGEPTEESNSSPIVVSVTKDLVGQFHAGNILKGIASVMDGKGGGRPDFAQGAGPNSAKAQEAVEKAIAFV